MFRIFGHGRQETPQSHHHQDHRLIDSISAIISISISAIISISTIINSNSTIIRIIDSYRTKRDLCR